jgi:hypothetical protein
MEADPVMDAVGKCSRELDEFLPLNPRLAFHPREVAYLDLYLPAVDEEDESDDEADDDEGQAGAGVAPLDA